MYTPFLALKFHIWLFHTSAVFLHLSLPFSQSWHSPLLRAQLNQWYGDFLILMPGHCCHFCLYSLAQLFCQLKRDSNSTLSPPPFHATSIVTQGFKIWVLGQCMSATGLHELFKQQPEWSCACSWTVWMEGQKKQKHYHENAHPDHGQALGYLTIRQLLPEDKHHLSLNETEVKYLNTSKSQGWEV